MLELDKIYCVDVLQGLRQLDNESIDCVITSPPYWNLRDYKTEPIVWDAKDGCDHEWNEKVVQSPNSSGGLGHKQDTVRGSHNVDYSDRTRKSDFCSKCGAWKGNLGLEPTFDLYVKHLCDVFDEVKRVLKKTGTVWINIGDTYSGGGAGQKITGSNRYADDIGLKPKDLIGIPWRVAFALQSDGWWLRQDIIWAKPNPMPESVTDRCTKSHEYIFLLTKNKDYYYDAESIKENTEQILTRKGSGIPLHGVIGEGRNDRENFAKDITTIGRNKRSVWTITTKPFRDAHFATFPEDLIEPMILAGTSEKGVCPDCGKPWTRIMNVNRPADYDPSVVDPLSAKYHRKASGSHGTQRPLSKMFKDTLGSSRETLGWKPSCKCNKDPIPALVLDPFCGSGTACLVAKKLGRSYIGFDLNPEYVKMANNSILCDRDTHVMNTLRLIDNGKQKRLEL